MANPIRAVAAVSMLLACAFVPARAAETATIEAIGVYRAIGSPVLHTMGIRCRFEPTCSRYAQLAIQKYGVTRGVLKAGGRILRCHPFNSSARLDYP